jgi:hypothetical protein
MILDSNITEVDMNMNKMCMVRFTAFLGNDCVDTRPDYVAGTVEQVKAEMDKNGSLAYEFFEEIHGSIIEKKIEIEEVDEEFMIQILGNYDTLIEMFIDDMSDLKSRDGSVDYTEEIVCTQKHIDIFTDGKKEIEKRMYEDCSNS